MDGRLPTVTVTSNLVHFLLALLIVFPMLLLPGSQLGHPGNHFRIGFGRENLPAAVERLEAFLDRA